MTYQGIFFDLDGTLIDSKLDFDAMRDELKFPTGAPILEEIEMLTDPKDIARAEEIVHKHEWKGALDSQIISGVKEVLELIREHRLATGVLTRNSRVCADYMIKHHGLNFEYVLTREDCKPKPDPEGLLKLASSYKIDPKYCLYVGDFKFDLETARNAKMASALYTQDPDCPFKEEATHCFSSFKDFISSILMR